MVNASTYKYPKRAEAGMLLSPNLSLCFADDQILVAQDQEDLNYITRKLIEEYKKWDLEVNIKKN